MMVVRKVDGHRHIFAVGASALADLVDLKTHNSHTLTLESLNDVVRQLGLRKRRPEHLTVRGIDGPCVDRERFYTTGVVLERR
jgi:hypothetical protein